MRSMLVVTTFLLVFAISPVGAAEIENCSRYPEYQQKTDCLHKNEILMNSTLEVVAAELRKAVQDLQGEFRQLKIDVQALKSSTLDLGNVLRIRS